MSGRVLIVGTGSVMVAAVVAVALAYPGSAGNDNGAQVEPSATIPALPAAAEEAIAPESVVVTTTTSPVIAPDPILAANQQRLNDLGFWIGAVDGRFGGATQQAIYAFQKLHGLPRTGSFDSPTLTAMSTAERPPASTSGDLIEVDKAHQVILVIRNGKTMWAFNTSTGTERPYVTNGIKGFAHTPTGTFRVNRQVDGVDPGDLGPLYRPRYFTFNGVAIHGAGSVPPQPASHGCARVSNAAMDFIWANNLMPMGSIVWVYDNPATQPFIPPTTAPPATTTTSTTPALPPTTTATPLVPLETSTSIAILTTTTTTATTVGQIR